MRSRKSPPVHSSGEGPFAQWRQTWRNPEKPILEMSANSLVMREAKAQQQNVAKAPLVRAGKPPSKGPMASYKRKDMGGISDDLAS